MATKEIIKIAPTLSAEERFKMVHPDLMRMQAGEKPLLTEAEMDAIRTCPRGEVLDTYNYHVLLVGWITLLWIRDWNAARSNVSLFGLVLLYETDRAMRDEDTDDKDPFDLVRDMVAHMDKIVKEFYAYSDSIPLLEKEFYGMSFWSEEMKTSIAREYENVDELIARHNDTIRRICEAPEAKTFLKPMVEDMESYLIPEPIPDPKRAMAIVLNLTEITEADVRRKR